MSVLGYALACALPAFLISLAATGMMRQLAPRWGLVDQPAARKVHSAPTPLGGGLGIVLGFVLPLLGAHLLVRGGIEESIARRWLPEGWSVHLPGVLNKAGQLWGIVAAGLVLFVMGLIDDLKGLPWKPRLAVQFLLAGGLCALGVRASVFCRTRMGRLDRYDRLDRGAGQCVQFSGQHGRSGRRHRAESPPRCSPP